MNIEDIQDEDSLRAWLESIDNDRVSISLASRGALRTQPKLWMVLEPTIENSGLTPLLFVWGAFACSVAAVTPTEEVKSAVAAASPRCASAFDTAFAAADAGGSALAATEAHFAVRATSLAMKSVLSTGASRTASVLSFANDACSTNSWACVRVDCSALVAEVPVWDLPLCDDKQFAAQGWRHTKSAWEAVGAPWDTFARIYDDFWHGREPDWDYLERIVLIAPEIWDAGPEAVAEAIARIDEQLALRDALLQGEDALDQALSASSLPGIGDNQGPPLDETTALPDFVSISFSINQLTTALDEPKLEHARVQSLAEKLLAMVNGAKKGLFALAGLTIGGVAAAAGWDIYATGGEQLIANLDRIAELAERVRQFALE